jgi:serine/threonine protein kinase/tetratricopeptide (TPR) repeat protein
MPGSSFQVGQSVLHYRIVDKIGAGGMGEVYRATDTKLGREVALKVLPVDMALDPDRLSRFQREARAIAALNNPHIVTIYSVEEAGGTHFLTMELVEGLSLDRLILPSGLSVAQVVNIASALADAIAAAHEKGIVHRDLKPANVMVSTDGRVKVLDFGLAKDVSVSEAGEATLTAAGLTQAGLVMGTPAYMSPEQIAGRAVDHRTDIFSLGVMLHEMITGRRPFEGTSLAELASAVLRDTPVSMSEVRADLPSDLVRITRRCLEKDPRHRMQTARDVINEFRDLARQTSQGLAPPPPASRAVPSADSGSARADEGFWVAVLPVKCAGASTELKALGDGLCEEIVAGLSRFTYLRVITSRSTQRYADQSPDLRVVGKDLGARYVMSASLRQVGVRVRVTVQLIDASTGAQLWAETYERPFSPDAVFEIQDNLVPRIVSTVADAYGVLPHTMSQEVRNKPVRQLTPYEALLRSFSYAERVTPEEHSDAKAALEQALQQAPGSSDCWAMLSILFSDEHVHGFGGPPDPLGRALQAARRAVDTNSGNHKAHQALAWALCHRKEFPASRVAAERTLALNPLDACAAVYMGFTIAFSGEWERGCELVTKSIELNPNHPGWYWFVPSLNAYRKNDYRAALELALKINMPGFTYGIVSLAAAYGQLGETQSARSAVNELLALRPDYASIACIELGKVVDRKLADHVVDGLRKAGLVIPKAESSKGTASRREPSR